MILLCINLVGSGNASGHILATAGHILAREFPDAKDGHHRLFPNQTNISAVIIPHYRSFDAVDLAVTRICIGTLVLSSNIVKCLLFHPSTPAVQRILSGYHRRSIMTEVSQINAAGSAVLGNLSYSDGAVPSSLIRISSPVQGQSVEVLLKQAFFQPDRCRC